MRRRDPAIRKQASKQESSGRVDLENSVLHAASTDDGGGERRGEKEKRVEQAAVVAAPRGMVGMKSWNWEEEEERKLPLQRLTGAAINDIEN